jgi:hypothetical protein
MVTRPERAASGKLGAMADDGLPIDLRDRVEAELAERQASREVDRFFCCPVCGQSVDRQDFRAVLHHDASPHKPL